MSINNPFSLPEVFMGVLEYLQVKKVNRGLYNEDRCGILRLFTVCKEWKSILTQEVHHSLSLNVKNEICHVLSSLQYIKQLVLVISQDTTPIDLFDGLNALSSRSPIQLEFIFQNCRWTDAEFNKTMEWICLNDLKFRSIQLSVSSCRLLKRPFLASNIQQVSIRGCQRFQSISPLGLSRRALTNVKIIECGSFGDDGMNQLFTAFTSLRSASFRSNGQIERPLIESNTLESIEFHLCKLLSDSSIEYLAENCSKLEQLSVTQCPQLNPSIASKTLQEVTITACQRMSWSMVQALCRQCPSLLSLSLHNCPGTVSQSVPTLSSQSLRSLKLNTCHGVTDTMIDATMSQCPNLEGLELIHLPKLSHPTVPATLKRMRVSSCANLETIIPIEEEKKMPLKHSCSLN